MRGARTLRMPWRSGTSARRGRGERALGFDGRLQAVVNGQAVGWAWDASHPEQRVKVAIEIEEEIHAEGVADIFRDELVAEGIGDGSHGFSLDLPETFQAHPHVRLVAKVGPDNVRLPRSPSFWHSATPGGLWGGVNFSYGVPGDSEAGADKPVEVPAPAGSLPLRALAGRDGWLFDAAGLEQLTAPAADLVERALQGLVGIARGCAEVGVAYLPALVPDKLDAVSEGSPVDAAPRGAWPRMLRARLRDVDEVEVLDLLPVLQDARRHGPCFHRSDVNWNDRGAFFISRALIKEAAKRAPALRPLPMERLHLLERLGYRGALADLPRVRLDGEKLVAIDQEFSDEAGVEVDASHLTAERMPVERHLSDGEVHVRLLVRSDAARGPRLSVVGDAACLPLLPWLAESVQRTTFFWSSTPPLEPIELELPDALLHLIRERDLVSLASAQPATP